MVAGGVALWSAPVVAAATFSRSDARSAADDARRRIQDQLDELNLPGGAASQSAAEPSGVVAQQTPQDCNSYPPGTCVTFECGGSHVVCGEGAGGYDCFCDVDATSACVCRNDAKCSDLVTCSAANGNGDCPAGYFCIPTSCCGIPKCAPPCGTLPEGAEEASPFNNFIPILNSIFPGGIPTLSGF